MGAAARHERRGYRRPHPLVARRAEHLLPRSRRTLAGAGNAWAVGDLLRRALFDRPAVQRQTDVLLAEGVTCGSRSWRRVRWEVISAAGWRQRDTMWCSLRAAHMGMHCAGTVSRLKARSATFI